jgi:hypothetical protein
MKTNGAGVCAPDETLLRCDFAREPKRRLIRVRDGVLWYCDAGKGWICNLT